MSEQAPPADLTLIDGYGYIFRAFYALPPMSRADGIPVNAVYGFCRMLAALLRDPTRLEADSGICAVAFDAPGKTFRHRLYPAYKAQRKDTPPDLLPQFAITREAARAFSLACLEVVDFEADDVIASYVRAARERGWSVEVYSGDKDLMQLIAPQVRLRDPMKGLVLAEQAAIKRFGVLPQKILDVMALAGDASDNIPGVPGIGVKTAAELIERFETLEGVLSSCDRVSQPKRRALLEEYGEQARLSRRLATLYDTVPLPVSLEDLRQPPIDNETLRSFFQKQNFASLIRELDARAESGEAESKAADSPSKRQPSSSPILETPAQLARALETLARCAQAALFLVEEELQASSLPSLAGVAFACPRVPPFYVAISESLPQSQVLQALKPFFEDKSVLKIGYNLKQVCQRLQAEAIDPNALEDLMLVSYVLDAGKHSHALEELSERVLQRTLPTRDQLLGNRRNKRRVKDLPLPQAAAYACAVASSLLNLRPLLAERLWREKSKNLYETLERPLIPILARMQRIGMLIDCDALEELTAAYTRRLESLEQEIFTLAGERFSIASPKQLAEVLFVRMKLAKVKKTATGQFSTNADVLEPLAAEGHKIAALVLDWRHLAKLISTYTSALPRAVGKPSGRIHTTFSMIGAQTGRLASSNPNLQNIPVRDQEGKDIRRCFIAEKGWKLITLDYSQIELRLIASIAKVEGMCKAFRAEGEASDIHRATAAAMFSLPLRQISFEQRRQAKAINFGLLYGMSRFGLARQLRVSEHEAQQFIDLYLQRYPEILTYRMQVVLFCQEKGYVETLMGRRIHLPAMQARNHHVRAHAERQAINAPIQGTAADIVKQAMVRVSRAISNKEISARLLLQVHDELLLEAPASSAEDTARKVQALMQGAAEPQMPLSVGLDVSYRIGDNWITA